MSVWIPGGTRLLVTGGAGFIGSCLVRRLLKETKAIVFNLDKLGYASDLTSIENLEELEDRHTLLKVDLADSVSTHEAVAHADPDLVMHLAAESHVDRSIDGPETFIDSNVRGTFNLLEAVRCHWDGLPEVRKKNFRLHHISTDEVFGSLGATGSFSEITPYDPCSPYSASKAASDHLVRAWNRTYGLPVVITNCSNNYGPWQFPEKLIPVVILKALACQSIPLYGDGENIRDWLYVEDHVEALLLAATSGRLGESYCIGGYGERTNKQVVESICSILDDLRPKNQPYSSLITKVKDRPGHDRRYSINSQKISNELAWKPKHNFEEGLFFTVKWYINNLEWCHLISTKSGYEGERIGTFS